MPWCTSPRAGRHRGRHCRRARGWALSGAKFLQAVAPARSSLSCTRLPPAVALRDPRGYALVAAGRSRPRRRRRERRLADWARAPERAAAAHPLLVWRRSPVPAVHAHAAALDAAYFLAFAARAGAPSPPTCAAASRASPARRAGRRLSRLAPRCTTASIPQGRFDLFDIERSWTGPRRRCRQAAHGAHFGSFEAMRRLAARSRPCVVMPCTRTTRAASTACRRRFIRARCRLWRWARASMSSSATPVGGRAGRRLADRTLGESRPRRDFLARSAFPTAHALAAALRQRVLSCGHLPRRQPSTRCASRARRLQRPRWAHPRQRDARVRAAVERYASRLDHYCREGRTTWFNFHDF